MGWRIFVEKLEWDPLLYLKWKFFDLIKKKVNLARDLCFYLFIVLTLEPRLLFQGLDQGGR